MEEITEDVPRRLSCKTKDRFANDNEGGSMMNIMGYIKNDSSNKPSDAPEGVPGY